MAGRRVEEDVCHERRHGARAGAGGQDVVAGDVEAVLHILVLLRLLEHRLLVALRRQQLHPHRARLGRAALAEDVVPDHHLLRLGGLVVFHLEAVAHQLVHQCRLAGAWHAHDHGLLDGLRLGRHGEGQPALDLLELLENLEDLVAQHAERRLVRLVPMEFEHTHVVRHQLVQALREHRGRSEALLAQRARKLLLQVLWRRVGVELMSALLRRWRRLAHLFRRALREYPWEPANLRQSPRAALHVHLRDHPLFAAVGRPHHQPVDTWSCSLRYMALDYVGLQPNPRQHAPGAVAQRDAVAAQVACGVLLSHDADGLLPVVGDVVVLVRVDRARALRVDRPHLRAQRGGVARDERLRVVLDGRVVLPVEEEVDDAHDAADLVARVLRHPVQPRLHRRRRAVEVLDDAGLEMHQDRHRPQRVVVAPLEALLECLHEAIVVVGADLLLGFKRAQGIVAVLQVGLHALVERGLVQSQVQHREPPQLICK
eukprot:scaffold81257_cov58-Phaeocystis_antarctica.AAC.3